MSTSASLGRGFARYACCLALSYIALLVSSILVCLPTLAVLRDLGIGRLPGGDRTLFEPGALLLLEAVRIGRTQLAGSLESSALSAVLASLCTLPVVAAVMVRLAGPERTAWRLWLGGAVRPLPAFLMLGGVTMLCRAGVSILLGFSAVRYHDVMLAAFGAKPADLTLIATVLVGMLLLATLGALQDLARAVAVTHRVDGYSALQQGLLLARQRTLRWILPWSVAAAGTLAAMLIVAAAAAVFDLSSAGAGTPAVWFLVCQAAVVVALASRIWWFDRALRLARVYARAPIA
jgi:hypothetical protein